MQPRLPAERAALPRQSAVKRAALQLGYSREAPVAATFRGATPICVPARRRTRVTSCSTSRQSEGSTTCRVTVFGLMPMNDPVLADAVLTAMRAPPIPP